MLGSLDYVGGWCSLAISWSIWRCWMKGWSSCEYVFSLDWIFSGSNYRYKLIFNQPTRTPRWSTVWWIMRILVCVGWGASWRAIGRISHHRPPARQLVGSFQFYVYIVWPYPHTIPQGVSILPTNQVVVQSQHLGANYMNDNFIQYLLVLRDFLLESITLIL